MYRDADAERCVPADEAAAGGQPENGVGPASATDMAAAPVVLFLCTGNYYRSRYAEILFNHLARERGLRWAAESRGLDLGAGVNNVGPLSPHTRRACQASGLAMPEPLRGPVALCDDDLGRARLVVALKEAEHRPYMARLFPDWAERVRYWHVHDLDRASADHALPEIDRLVRALADELAAPAPAPAAGERAP